MPDYSFEDEYPECPECGDDSGECECDRPFNFPFVYIEPNLKKELCVKCGKNPRLAEGESDYTICKSCLYNTSNWRNYIASQKVIA